MSKEKAMVSFRGTTVAAGWPAKIKAEQANVGLRMTRNGKVYRRIRMGDPGDWAAEHSEIVVCHDCGAIKGEIHVSGCDAERCPKCRRQLIGCSCGWKFLAVEETKTKG